MFNITSDNGFHITLTNGWTVSVQWGVGNYCDNHSLWQFFGKKAPPSKTAEVWCWSPKGVETPEHLVNVKGYLNPDEVLAYIADVARQPSAVEGLEGQDGWD